MEIDDSLASESFQYAEDAPFEKRLRLWLLDQPEYLVILALPRPQRRSGLRRVANIILTFPEANVKPGANRVESRAQMNQLKKRLSKQLDKAQQKKSRQQRALDAHRRRAMRLSDKRIALLIERERAQVVAKALLSDSESIVSETTGQPPFQADLLDDKQRQTIVDALNEGYPHDPALD